MLNKKGFTLVEVVVALGILAIVFTGTVTLVVNVFNLELSSRSLTEAVAIAQGKMAETVASLDGGCFINTPISMTEPVPIDDKYTYLISNEAFDYSVTDGFTSENFLKIKVTVSWEDKGIGERTYELEQIVRNN